MRIELTTSSLPRKCSTTELQQLNLVFGFQEKKYSIYHTILLENLKLSVSGRPGSNRPPSAWKADALPNELLPQFYYLIKIKNLNFYSVFPQLFNISLQLPVGGEGFEPSKSKDNGFTVRPIWPLWYPPS